MKLSSHHSEESRKNISKNSARIWLGKKLPQIVKDKISATRKKLFNEGKLKPSAGYTGKKHTKKIKQKMREKMSLSYDERYGIRANEERQKRSLALKGKKKPWASGSKSHFWRGGVTPEYKAVRNSLEYKLWRESVFKRDNYTCVWCGDKNGSGKVVILNADHIKPFAFFPDLRFAIDNGRTLCIPCHKTTETFGNRNKKIT